MLLVLRCLAARTLAGGLIAAIAACGAETEDANLDSGPSPYAGILWEAEALNEEITGCRGRQEERFGVESARVYCKCVYIGLSKLSTYEQFNADKNAVTQTFSQNNGIKDCETWVDTKKRVDQETQNHGVYRSEDGDWVDMYTGEQYPHHVLFY